MKRDGFQRACSQSLLRRTWLRSFKSPSSRRSVHSDTFQRQSSFWIPPTIRAKQHGAPTDTTQLLARAGYLRQAYSGIFHMLPLGLRVQNKIERLIDKHMMLIGASKVSLSSISSQELWHRSGRLSTGSEFFKFSDRKDAKWLLTPTHEEEITEVVGGIAQSYRDMPIRLYQVGRKYRDERRPRGGLLRGREFVMKDLYTFDQNEADARATYDTVRSTYVKIFEELKIGFLEARADSGNMGGSLSHEFHLSHSSGEDNIIHCSSCGYTVNEELVEEVDYERQKIPVPFVKLVPENGHIEMQISEFMAISKDGATLVKAYAPKLPSKVDTAASVDSQISTFAIKAAFENVLDLDTGVEDPASRFLGSIASNAIVASDANKKDHSIYYLFDERIGGAQTFREIEKDYELLRENSISAFRVVSSPTSPTKIQLLRRQEGDQCPSCRQDTIEIRRAIEVGHTFHLGTRYSSKLGARILQAGDKEATPIEMGCHGIGVSRLVAAIAACLSDEKGLNWPRAVAPFQVVMIVDRNQSPELVEAVESLGKSISAIPDDPDAFTDVLYDDRKLVNLTWKMNDADFIGYPVLLVFGRSWKAGERMVEVQCRRLKVKELVAYDEVPTYVQYLLAQL